MLPDDSQPHHDLRSLAQKPGVAGHTWVFLNWLLGLHRLVFLLNVMGYLDDEEILGATSLRVFFDIDLGFGQMWRELGLADVFAGHDQFVTIGENIGRPDCAIPTCGLNSDRVLMRLLESVGVA